MGGGDSSSHVGRKPGMWEEGNGSSHVGRKPGMWEDGMAVARDGQEDRIHE